MLKLSKKQRKWNIIVEFTIITNYKLRKKNWNEMSNWQVTTPVPAYYLSIQLSLWISFWMKRDSCLPCQQSQHSASTY